MVTPWLHWLLHFNLKLVCIVYQLRHVWASSRANGGHLLNRWLHCQAATVTWQKSVSDYFTNKQATQNKQTTPASTVASTIDPECPSPPRSPTTCQALTSCSPPASSQATESRCTSECCRRDLTKPNQPDDPAVWLRQSARTVEHVARHHKDIRDLNQVWKKTEVRLISEGMNGIAVAEELTVRSAQTVETVS